MGQRRQRRESSPVGARLLVDAGVCEAGKEEHRKHKTTAWRGNVVATILHR